MTVEGTEMNYSSIDDLLVRIQKNFQDIRINTFYLEETGWMNNVLIINNSIVFRFPKTSKMEDKLKKEINLLSVLKNCPVKIPEYMFISKNGPLFGGYYLINGVALNSSKSLGPVLVGDFKRFLDYLASCNTCIINRGTIDIYDEITWKKHEESIINMFAKSLETLVDRTYFDILLNMMDKAFSDLSQEDFSLIHGDLSGNNVLINNRHNKLNGVIDWADSCYGDKALDIAAIVDDFSYKYAMQLLEIHDSGFHNRLLQRVLFYRAVSPLYYAHYLSRIKSNALQDYCNLILTGKGYKKRLKDAENVLK